jgi:hypothetical protein
MPLPSISAPLSKAIRVSRASKTSETQGLASFAQRPLCGKQAELGERDSAPGREARDRHSQSQSDTMDS